MSGRPFFRITLKVGTDNCRNQAISLKTRRGPNGTILPFA